MTPSVLPQQTPDPRPRSFDFDRVGRIVAVTGSHAIILLDNNPELAIQGAFKSPEIGTLLKVDTTPSIALALVSALSAPAPGHGDVEQELRIVEVEFIGELPKDDQGRPRSFRRGISCYPSLGDVVARASKDELSMAYACNAETAIRIGHVQQDSTIPAMVKIDDLLGKHFAVLGTTGTGKSCAVALILRRILEKSPQAHVLLLDVHREYGPSFRRWAETITPDNLNLPFWLLNFEEIVETLIGSQPNREVDIEILRELIPAAKMRYMANQRRDRSGALRQRDQIDTQNVGVDTPVPYRASDLVALLDEALGKLDLKGELAPYKRLKSRVETITRDPRYAFMFGSLTVQDTMTQVLARLFRIPVNNKPITILELGGLPSEIINVVVSVLARMAFDFGVWSGGRVPITFVCEEAHRYVPIDQTLGFEPTKRSISRIAKEGRKYGVSLCIVSQRPAELDPTILSQCNTIFSLRLTNERDQEILKAGISDAAASLLEFMPTMGPGEAIAFGEGVALPTRIKFDLLPEDALPQSTTASFSQNWTTEVHDDGFLADVVARWRLQSHNTASEPAPADQVAAAAQEAPPAVAAARATAQGAAPAPARAAAPTAAPSGPRFGQQAGAPARVAASAAAAPAPAIGQPATAQPNRPSLSELLRQVKGNS
ncbi:MAG: ATP-binding protein [Parvibaculaceae bacterium]